MTLIPTLRVAARWGLYPLSWVFLVAMAVHAKSGGIEPRAAWGLFVAGLLCLYIVMERLIPYEHRWSMTWKTFRTDLKYIVVNSAVLSGLSALMNLYAITISGDLSGPASDWPFWAQLLAALLIFEAVNYTLHRAMHEGRGGIGAFLWKSHAAHHLPDRVYVVMHAVFHPVNSILIQLLALILPIWAMGYDQLAVAVFLMINSMHGLISHFNVDVRMGWANYIFVGTELHRYHHSADVSEGKNYGATLSVYDQLFGTFVYRPGTPPEQLGVSADLGFPPYQNYFEVLRLPFRKSRPGIAASSA